MEAQNGKKQAVTYPIKPVDLLIFNFSFLAQEKTWYGFYTAIPGQQDWTPMVKEHFFSGMLWYSLSTELTYLTSSLLLIARRYSDNLIYSMIMSIGIISLKSRSKGIIPLKL